MLQAQVASAQTSDEVAAYVERFNALMLKNGTQPSHHFFVTQLKAGLRLNDLKVRVKKGRSLD